jgi:hypothetical protein
VRALGEKWRSKEQATSLRGYDIGCSTSLANTRNKLFVDCLILQKWDDVDKDNTLLGEIFVVFKYLFHSTLIYKTYKVNKFLWDNGGINNKFYKFVTRKIVLNIKI